MYVYVTQHWRNKVFRLKDREWHNPLADKEYLTSMDDINKLVANGFGNPILAISSEQKHWYGTEMYLYNKESGELEFVKAFHDSSD